MTQDPPAPASQRTQRFVLTAVSLATPRADHRQRSRTHQHRCPAHVTAETKLPRHQAGQVSIFSCYVELTGFEPVTPTLPVWCATNCAIAPYVNGM